MKKKIVFYLVLFIPKFAYAYQFKQAKFKNFNVVFPQQIEGDIPKFLTQLDKIYDLTFFSLGEHLENIKIFLGNSSEVNAFAIVPNRASYVNYDFLCSTYLSTLVHEMRHIAQYSSFFRPLKSPLKCLFVIDLDKSWLMEGDAVITETILTSDGRGRDPYFLLYEKTKILNDDENINYASFYYNNWYTTGYLLCTHIRKYYGIKTFRKLFTDNSLSGFPSLINYRLKKYTKKNIKEIFCDIKKELRIKWLKQLQNLKISDFQKVNSEVKDYYNPQEFRDGIIALKVSKFIDGKTELAHFVFFKDGKETWLKDFDFKLGHVGFPTSRNVDFSCAKNKIVLCGTRDKIENTKLNTSFKHPDNAIYVLDSKKKTVEIIDTFPYCKNPVFSHDASKIAFFSSDKQGIPYLIILDGEKFNVIEQHKLEKYHSYMSPIFSYKDEKIIFIDHFDGKSSIKSIKGDKIEKIYTSNHIWGEIAENIGKLAENENFIFFSSSYSGIDNIYALDKSNNKIFQVTSSKYGAYRPRLVGDYLVYNDYNKHCRYDIAKINIDVNAWTPLEMVENRNIYLFEDLKEQEKTPSTTEEFLNLEPIKDCEYKRKPPFLYKSLLGPLNFPVPNPNKILAYCIRYIKSYEDNKSNPLNENIYSTSAAFNAYNYDSGISFGLSLKSNIKRNLLNFETEYIFLDHHKVNFQTVVVDIAKGGKFFEDWYFFDENILSYDLFLNNFIGKKAYSFNPGIQSCLRYKKDKFKLDTLLKTRFSLSSIYNRNTFVFALEKFDFFVKHKYNHNFDIKNSLSINSYCFKVGLEDVKDNSLMFRKLNDYKQIGCIRELFGESGRKKLEKLSNLYQFGFSLGYRYVIPLNYSLENLSDIYYNLFVRNIAIKPKIKVDIPMFGNNIYSFVNRFDITVLKNGFISFELGMTSKKGHISYFYNLKTFILFT